MDEIPPALIIVARIGRASNLYAAILAFKTVETNLQQFWE